MTSELTELGANVDRHPRDVAERAAQMHQAARSIHDADAQARAATMLSRARRNLGEIRLAELAIDEAIRVAEPIGGDTLADAHLVAASIASFGRGAERSAFHLREAARFGSKQVRLDVTVQSAVLAKRQGRLDDAMDLFAEVLPVLRLGEDRITTARVLSNRGSVRVLRGDITDALRDFDEARTLFETEGQEFAAALVTENMAEAAVNNGDIPRALALLDEAGQRAAGHDHHLYEAGLAKAEALMTAGLFDDAIELLTQSVELFAAEGDQRSVARSLLLCAEAHRLGGHGRGPELAARALQAFERMGLTGEALQAELELVRTAAELPSAAAQPGVIDRAEALARRLTDSGRARIEVEAWSLVATLSLRTGDLSRARAAAQRCATRAAALPFVEHRMAAEHAMASVDIASGDFRRAERRIDHVLDEFAAYRRGFDHVDARSASAAHATSLAALGAELASDSEDADRLLAWSEARRNDAPVWGITPDSEPPSAEAAELRSVVSELRAVETTASPSGRDLGTLHRRRAALEQQIRDRLLSNTQRTTAAGAGSASEDSLVLPPDVVGVSFDAIGDDLVATIVSHRRTRLVRLGSLDEIRSLCSAATKLLAAGVQPPDAAGDERLLTALHRLDARVIQPLELVGRRVMMAMPAEFHAVPWGATQTLSPLRISLVPSLSSCCNLRSSGVRRRQGVDGRPGRITTVAGPRLEHAESEALAVAACHPDAAALVGSDAGVDAVIDAFGTSDVVHIAAHTRLRHDNPMWSSIELADGPLHLHRLARQRTTATTVVLSTCESSAPAGRRGHELAGSASVLLATGAASVIATSTLLPDDPATCDTMVALHHLLVGGAEPSVALASLRARNERPLLASALVAWGCR